MVKLSLGINQIFKDKKDVKPLSDKLMLYEASEINSPSFYKTSGTESDLE